MTRWLSRSILLFTLLLWGATVVLPALGLIHASITKPSSGVDVRPSMQLLATSVGWAALVAAISMAVGWLPGRWLGTLMQQRRWGTVAVVITLTLAPIALPSYVIFYAWWQSWPAESAFYQWAVSNGHMQLGRNLTLLLGLVCWSWPLVSLCVMGSAAQRPGWRDDLQTIDGCGVVARWIDRLRTDRRGILLGGLVVFLAALGNTTCFDLAEIFTFANELRAIEALGASPREILTAAWPIAAVSLASSVLLWQLLKGRMDVQTVGHRRGERLSVVVTATAWLISVALPLSLFFSHLLNAHGSLSRILVEFDALYQDSARHTLMNAAVSGLLAALMMLGLVLAWQSGSRAIRWLAVAMSVSWLFLALIPGTLTGIALRESGTLAFLRSGFAWSILSMGHLAVLGFVAVLMARWVVATEPRELRDLRLIDGPTGFIQFIRAQYPRLLVAVVPTAIITFVLAVGEIPVTAMINPPHRAGAGPLALSILNDMHYQRPQTVMVAASGMMVLALLAAGAMALAMVFSRKTSQLRPTIWTPQRGEA